MKNFRILALLICIAIISSFLTVGVSASNETTVSVGNVMSKYGDSISVPIKLSNNAGICGATFSISYDKNLILTGIEKGTALSDLTMTKPGDLSANPVNLVWDGLEPDMSNGIIANLTFTVPNVEGTYPVSVSYEEGDILDGNIEPIPVTTQNGNIVIAAKPQTDIAAFSVGRVTASPNTSVSVPIRLSDNTGICGATLSVHYDKNLVLTNIVKGTALSTLTMTKPGNLSANPINLVWDGLEADMTNGIVATLTFTAPNQSGTYNISLSYEDGDILDGNISPVNVKLVSGEITVGSTKNAVVEIEGKSVTLSHDNIADGEIITAFYNSKGILLSLKTFAAAAEPIIINEVQSNASYAKVMWWESTSSVRPLCKPQTIIFDK